MQQNAPFCVLLKNNFLDMWNTFLLYFAAARQDITYKIILHNISQSGRGVQHFVIKFVSDLQHVGGFLRGPPPIKLTTTI